MTQGAVTKIIKKNKKTILLVKGNPPRSGNNTAPVIATIYCTKYGHSCSFSADSDCLWCQPTVWRPNQDGGVTGLRSSTPWGVYVYYVCGKHSRLVIAVVREPRCQKRPWLELEQESANSWLRSERAADKTTSSSQREKHIPVSVQQKPFFHFWNNIMLHNVLQVARGYCRFGV